MTPVTSPFPLKYILLRILYLLGPFVSQTTLWVWGRQIGCTRCVYSNEFVVTARDSSVKGSEVEPGIIGITFVC